LSLRIIYAIIICLKELKKAVSSPQKSKPCCDCVRLVLMLFCILLTGVLIALSFQCTHVPLTLKKFEDLHQLQNTLNENLTAFSVALQDMHHWAQNLSKAPKDSACPKDWEYHAGKCYHFSTNELNWTDSPDACISDGGHLLIINSRDKPFYLFWIGLTDEKNRWLWVDNTKLNEDIGYWTAKEQDNWPGHEGVLQWRELCSHNYIQELNRCLMQSATTHSGYVHTQPELSLSDLFFPSRNICVHTKL
uniref:Immune-related, lectin-like receptor 4 n=1 Tax=Sinocyclocheilus anshuiensis TaxID=1608454 RepID=A0A671S3V1_9TELE